MPDVPLNFQISEYEDRISKTRQAMESSGVELMITVDPSNMAWLTGYDGWSFYTPQCVLLTLSDGPIWFGRAMDAKGALRTVFMPEHDIWFYTDDYVMTPERHAMDLLSQKITDRGWGALRIGVEMDNYYFSAATHQSLEKGLPNATFIDANLLVNWQRTVKSEQELIYMKRAGRIVETMHEMIFEKIEPGMRKNDLVAEIYRTAIAGTDGHGGDYPAIVPMVPSGVDTSTAHLTWNDLPFNSDEGSFFEIAGCHRRYHCPLCRTIYLGEPPLKFLNVEKAVLEGMEAGLEMARAGNLAEDIIIAFNRALNRYGITKDGRSGYPIGLSYPPDWGERTVSLRLGDRTVLEENMTFHFMTALWSDDWGFEITESIIIKQSGPELLANYPRKLLVKK
ncbi:MAG: ectoine hydrolase DoeA [Acidiferrobacterales bacterium]|nr:ectoine hydrolase DoeA [Acidiferrobacterales bacterium]